MTIDFTKEEDAPNVLQTESDKGTDEQINVETYQETLKEIREAINRDSIKD